MPSPACEVKDGAAAYVATTNGVNITPTNTIVVRLVSQAGVSTWTPSVATTDDTSDAAAVTAALVIDSVAKTATFTAPAAGKCYRFKSVVNGGVDVNGVSQPTYTTYFTVYTLTVGGRRVHAVDETTEGGQFGWGTDLNGLIRTPEGTASPINDTGTGTINDRTTTSSGAVVSQVRHTGAAPTVTGYASGFDGRRLVVIATGGNLILANENAGSIAANRIVTGTGGNVTIANGSGAVLAYDATSSRWRLTGDGAGGGSVAGADTQVIFNDGGVEAGDAGFTYNKTTDTATLAGGAIAAYLATTGTLPAVGLVRVPYAATDTVIGSKDSGGTDRAILSRSSADYYQLGALAGVSLNVFSTSDMTVRSNAGEIVMLTAAAQPIRFQTNGTQVLRLGTTGNMQFGPGAEDAGGGVGVLGIDNAGTNPSTNPTNGVVIYSDGGAAKCRGSGGTVTTFGPADLDGFKATSGEGHCPSCRTDFAHEWSNDAYGSLTICMKCLADELGERPWIVKRPKAA